MKRKVSVYGANYRKFWRERWKKLPHGIFWGLGVQPKIAPSTVLCNSHPTSETVFPAKSIPGRAEGGWILTAQGATPQGLATRNAYARTLFMMSFHTPAGCCGTPDPVCHSMH